MLHRCLAHCNVLSYETWLYAEKHPQNLNGIMKTYAQNFLSLNSPVVNENRTKKISSDGFLPFLIVDEKGL